MVEGARRQIAVVRDQADEAIRRIELNIQALEASIAEAEDLRVEEVRAENKKLAYQLSQFGMDVITRVSTSGDQIGLHEELQSLLEAARGGAGVPSRKDDDLDAFFANEADEREEL